MVLTLAKTRQISVGLGLTFLVAVGAGPFFHNQAIFFGVLASGALWLLASVVPIWHPASQNSTNLNVVTAVFNSAAASTAVFSGLGALDAKYLPVFVAHIAN